MTICIVCAMAVFAVMDWKKRIIPNCLLMFLLVIWAGVTGRTMIIDVTEGMNLLFASLSGGIIGGLLFFMCYLLSHRQLGAGDVKLAFVLGLYLTGENILMAIFAGMMLCCGYAFTQLIKKKGQKVDGIPLAPFLFLGTLVALLF